jgi:glycosyltransferase involved in cell wall biosynthesis
VLVKALSRPELRERVRLELVGNMNASSEAAVRAAPPELEIDVSAPLPWRATIDRVAAADAVVVIFPPQLGDRVAWPVKTFEALALGKPILSLTGGGAGEALLRELGVAQGCARWDDVDSVAAAAARLLEAPPGPVEPERLARWDRSNVARDYDALLERLIAGAEGAPNPASQPVLAR